MMEFDQRQLDLGHDYRIIIVSTPMVSHSRMGRELNALYEAQCICGWAALYSSWYSAQDAAEAHVDEWERDRRQGCISDPPIVKP